MCGGDQGDGRTRCGRNQQRPTSERIDGIPDPGLRQRERRAEPVKRVGRYFVQDQRDADGSNDGGRNPDTCRHIHGITEWLAYVQVVPRSGGERFGLLELSDGRPSTRVRRSSLMQPNAGIGLNGLSAIMAGTRSAPREWQDQSLRTDQPRWRLGLCSS